MKFNPAIYTYTSLKSSDKFGHHLADEVANLIVNDFSRAQLDVSGFVVEEMTDEDKEEWKDFWEDDND